MATARDRWKVLIPTKTGVNTDRWGIKRKKIIYRIIGRRAGKLPVGLKSLVFGVCPA